MPTWNYDILQLVIGDMWCITELSYEDTWQHIVGETWHIFISYMWQVLIGCMWVMTQR